MYVRCVCDDAGEEDDRDRIEIACLLLQSTDYVKLGFESRRESQYALMYVYDYAFVHICRCTTAYWLGGFLLTGKPCGLITISQQWMLGYSVLEAQLDRIF